ncbi:MAG: flavin-containing monooxygenase [Pseudonocardia sp.]
MDVMPDNVAGSGPARIGVRELDAVVIGAGYGGMYALYRLRELGLSVRAYDAADGVGGTWWWNRYPGARVDFPGGPFYCYTFSEELVRGWDWTERLPDQPAVLGYLDYVADQLDLRRDIQLGTVVQSARFDETTARWLVETSHGERVSARFLICAVGTLSAASKPDIPGFDEFAGECFHTGRWPQDLEVDFTGKRVGVIGTGSSGVQAIPVIAREAAHLTVFQRTPQYSIPAGNRPLTPEFVQTARENWSEVRAEMFTTPLGAPLACGRPAELLASEHTPEQRRAVYEEFWRDGGLGILFSSYRDLLTDPDANETLAEFVRAKIRETVRDPAIAERLLPDYYIGTKRQILDDGYYETFNRDNVELVDLRAEPIEAITPDGVRTAAGEYPLDTLVLATGYDAMTGALLRIDPVGRGGVTLRDRWAEGPRTYLGVTVAGFPNMFMVHGPESPSVLFNMPLGAELLGDWIADCITHLREQGMTTVEADPTAEPGWGAQVREIAHQTLFPLTDSWYTGANIPGKPRQFGIHLGGIKYHEELAEVAAGGYPGLVFGGSVFGADGTDEGQESSSRSTISSHSDRLGMPKNRTRLPTGSPA